MESYQSLTLADEISRNSFEYFCRSILRQKIGSMHKEWINAIMTDKRHLCAMAPRGHFKTTILSIAFPLWIMYTTNTPKLFCILSATLDQSTEIMNGIKQRIEEIPILRRTLMPDNIHSTKWSETQIRTRNGHRIICAPFGDGIRGKHPDYFILDDILRAEVSTDIQDSKDTFYGTVFPAINARNGKMIVVGTPMAFTDLLFELSVKPFFCFIRRSAVILNPDGSWKEPCFPEHFTLEKLHEIHDNMPSHFWNREYMCSPISDSTSMFPQSVISKSLETFKTTAPIYATKQPLRYIGCDIAVSNNTQADFSVFTVVERFDDNPILVRDVVRGHFGNDGNLSELLRLHEFYHPVRIIVEQTGVGWGVANDCVNHPKLMGCTTTFDTKRKSKEQILSRLEITMRNGLLGIPNHDILLQELSTFGIKRSRDGKETYEGLGAHDDTVISLALALEAAWQAKPATLTLV